MKSITAPALIMMATLLFAIGMPVSAQASDWEEYEIVCDRDSVKLVDAVNKMIENGWQPLGGVAAGNIRTSAFVLCQVMVKE